MPGRRHTPDEIMRKLREADHLRSQGTTARDICHKLGIAENTYHRWRNHYDGLHGRQKRRLVVLEEENRRLKDLVATLSLQLQEAREYACSLETDLEDFKPRIAGSNGPIAN